MKSGGVNAESAMIGKHRNGGQERISSYHHGSLKNPAEFVSILATATPPLNW
jgi:hypothetical protein